MKFTKMNGAGNDFIIINNMKEGIPQEAFPTLARQLCHRRLGIGADGFMVVEAPLQDGDYRMLFFNADGTMGEMCGNGARCIARYGYENGLAGEVQRIETTAGLVTGWRLSEQQYRVMLNPVTTMQLDLPLEAQGKTWSCSYVELGDPGIPHAVVHIPGLRSQWIDDGEKAEELRTLGRTLRSHPAFPKGANINFYDITGKDQAEELTYERGVEDFTLACGTGTGSVTAVLTEKGLVSGTGVKIRVPGGLLQVSIEKKDGTMIPYLTGPTCVAATGEAGGDFLRQPALETEKAGAEASGGREAENRNRNITIIGMAGAGKSTTGVVVAKILKKEFIDGDLRIQTVTGRKLQDIINQDGNEAFREIERQVLCSIDAENSVIAPGGSAVYYPEAMAHLKEQGVVVYLHVPLPEIQRRLTNLTTRGITLKKGQTIADLYQERLPLYEEYADIRIDTEGCTLEQTVEKIVRAVKEYKR